MIRHIPNLVTLLNLLCGSVAVVFAVNGNMKITALFVFLGIFFDFFDGLLARKLKVQSELGLQLDSLADMVTSGLVPGLVMFYLLKLSGPDWMEYGLVSEQFRWDTDHVLPFFGFLITLASAYRLAKFNISSHQSEAFIGLPTPANALLILSLPLIMEYQNNDIMNAIILNKWVLIALTFLSAYLLNCKIQLLALKFKTWNFKDNAARYLLIIMSAVLLILFKFAAIPLIILLYIVISILNK
ncbi:MAG: CDP-alcohol phosphatidyltransferase family protein [Bacteroidia bacterium]|nr:CDP-alcohol phosphatidyltransferase family protein [Bacteroidia bacterium]MBT8278787.1 CDP-alcohol phosphatidyltransferase family protein [Bacteroidia bacterium]NND24799.1 phosphatidylserine synthase [Flavobacteriaceae bacterium]NNK60001.1 phosphatidylserine synthase [Flavobacteriaceae bacterium]NNL31967.1 phosphatidylserine synthase [Flavobacteriaceae bacterium]